MQYPWIRGLLACCATEADNPYKPGTRQHEAWLDGWEERKFYGGWVGPDAGKEVPPSPWDEVTDDTRRDGDG